MNKLKKVLDRFRQFFHIYNAKLSQMSKGHHLKKNEIFMKSQELQVVLKNLSISMLDSIFIEEDYRIYIYYHANTYRSRAFMKYLTITVRNRVESKNHALSLATASL